MPRGIPRNSVGVCHRCGRPYQRREGKQKFCGDCALPARVEYRLAYYRKTREDRLRAAKRWQESHRDHYLRSRREYEATKVKRIIKEVIDHYSGGLAKCVCCGQSERDFLTIDHVAGGGNKTCKTLGIPRGGSGLYRWLARNGFPPGYAVMCMNCNMSKGKHGTCVHKTRSVSIATRHVEASV